MSSRGLSSSGRCVPACSHTGADARLARRTPWPRSSVGWQPAPTGWSWTCTCRPTVWSSCVTMRRSTAPRMHPGRIDRRTAAELSRVDAGYRWTDAAGESSVQVLRHRRPEASRRSPPLPGRPDHHRDEGRSPRDGAGRWPPRSWPRRRSTACVRHRMAVGRFELRGRHCQPWPAARAAGKSALLSIAHGRIGPFVERGMAGIRCRRPLARFASYRPLLWGTHTMRGSRYRSGPWMTRQTWIDSWTGVSTPSSAIAPISRWAFAIGSCQ